MNRNGWQRVGANPLLATVGMALLLVAAAGYLLNRSAAVAGAFLVIGSALTLVSVLVERLEGKQELSLTKVSLNVASLVRVGNAESKAGTLQSLEDVR